MPIGSLILGLHNTIKGSQGLSKLHKEKFPTFEEVAAMENSRNRANQMAQGGYTAAETAAFTQNLVRQQNTAYTKAVDRAPGQSQAILAGLNYGNVNALNQFAANDANLHRENVRYADSFSKYLQQLNNQNIQEQITSRREAERAYGEAVKSGTESIAGHFDQDEADAKSLASSVGGMFLGGM